jgi:hypothetical protein
VTEGQTRTKANKEIIQWHTTSHMCHGIVVLVLLRLLEVREEHNQVEYKELQEGKFRFNLNGSYKNVFPDLCVDKLILKCVPSHYSSTHDFIVMTQSLNSNSYLAFCCMENSKKPFHLVRRMKSFCHC